MVAELISVGTELLLGNIVNTNANYLSKQCALLGLSLYYQSVVGDNEERLKETLKTAVSRADVVLITGGLGPTKDDLTKEAAAQVFGKELVEDPHTRERIEEYFKNSQYKTVTANNWKQALIPQDSIVVDNNNGTAPGIIMEKEGKSVILLPGPPGELIPMFKTSIFPYLNKHRPEIISSQMIKICGLGESFVETEILDLIEEQSNPTIAPYAKIGEVHLRITAKAANEEETGILITPVVEELKKRFGAYIYSMNEKETLEEVVIQLLKKKEFTLATAESCTGGLLSGRIVNVSGASQVFKGALVTYANEAKEKLLGVKKETLDQFGAVSEETAKEMAKGGAAAIGTHVCVAITGIAGPEGGTEEKPVGLVHMACFINNKYYTKKFHFKGNREKIRDYAVIQALVLLRESMLCY